jgi:hypothetical protein
MAKGQQRSTKEQRKQKSAEGKKDKTPRYLRGSAPGGLGKAAGGTEKKS